MTTFNTLLMGDAISGLPDWGVLAPKWGQKYLLGIFWCQEKLRKKWGFLDFQEDGFQILFWVVFSNILNSNLSKSRLRRFKRSFYTTLEWFSRHFTLWFLKKVACVAFKGTCSIYFYLGPLRNEILATIHYTTIHTVYSSVLHLFCELWPACTLEHSDVARDRKRLSMADLERL
uniref:Uncharacterized protein n=1 Tax=Cacopsylla melanoneura TaxID=428564 RepID=A0A8D8X558_9HEMI